MQRFAFPLVHARPGFDLRAALDIVESALDDEELTLLGRSGPFAVIEDGLFIVHVPDDLIVPRGAGGGHDEYDHLREDADLAEHQRHMRTGEYVDIEKCAHCARLVDSAT